MKKRKGEHVVDEGTPERKRKARDEKQSNHKSGEFARSLKGLLQKEHTRLSGLKQLLNVLKELQAKESVGDIIKEGGEFREIFTILEIGQQGLSKLEIQTCMEILERILLYTAEESQLANRLGVSIVQRVLQGHMKLLYSCLNPGNPPEVIKAALKLLTAMVTQGSSAAREVQSSFDFTLKSLGALPNKHDSNSAQDVRTCFIYFCLSFLMFGDLVVMKQILELKGFLQSVLKGLSLDKPEIVHTVLSALQGRVVHNSGITKKTKVQFFNSHVLSQLANLYQYTKDTRENNSEEQTCDPTVRQKVHDLLLKVCGSFKFGICFFNVAGAFSTRSNNPVLLRFLQTLSSATTDVLVQELVITVLCCCHDVVRPFLSSLTATYEPRLSMHWIANMNLLTKVYIALPQPSIMVEKYGVKMTKEILPTLVNIVVPVGLSRTSLSRGVQHASYLVKHTTLSLVIVILNRAQNAVQCLASSEDTAEDLANTTDASLVQQFREEVVKALPDVNTFISLRQNLVSSKTKGESQGEDLASPTIFLAESLKIIHGFQLLSPSLLSHINFDLRKLLSGQQEVKLPVIAQQLTLQILLHAPPGSLKWFQQKGKSSASFLYSILNVYTSARNEKIKTDAQQLVQKLLSETGLLNSLPHANEVEMWLSHLCHSQFEEHTKTLLRFLDEVFMAVASEPYLYTDIVIDLQAEAVSHEASALQFGLDPTDWTQSSNTSLPVSLLLVGALKRYCEMISNATEPGEKAEVLSLGCIAKYMNCVISDMIHSAMNPTILCFVLSHYVSNTEVSQHMARVRSAHKALLHYLSYWMPSFTQLQDKIDYLKVPSKTSSNSLKQLQSFLSRTMAQNEQEKATVSAELNRHLELLDEEQLGTVITDCVEFCKNQLGGQFSPLIQVLQVTNYRITGSSATEDIAPLLQALPFGVLVWQVLGEAIQGVKKTVNQWKTSTTDLSSFENETSSLLDNSWIQSLLVKALEKEPLVKTVPLFCHVLLYLRSLKAKLVVIRTSPENCMLRSAMQLCFELLQCLLQRLASLQDKMSEGKANASHETHNQGEMLFSLQSFDSPQNSCEPRCQGFSNVDNIYQTILHHPVIFDCFLWRPEHSLVGHVSRNIGTQLTYNVANVLLAVLPSLTVHQKRILMAPFVTKICKEGMLEIESANIGNVISSSQALYLLGLFHEYCDEENQVKFISHLSQLPSDMLVTTDAVSRDKVPSVCLTTLLTLLEGESFCEDHLSPLLSGRNPLKTEEPLLLSHFRQLVKISLDVNCPQLDYTILKLLQKSMLYVMGSTATFLDICLNQSTKAKIAIAAHLVKHCPSLRSHFELRCLDKPKPRKKPKALDITCTMFPVALKEHPAEFLPVVSSYLFCMRGISAEKLGCRTQVVVSHLVELYWAPLWAWLVSDREGIFKASEELSMDVLTALILHMPKDNNLLKQLNGLLTRASLWDRYQLRICRQLLTSQYRNFSTNEDGVNIISKFCFACMEFLSSNLIKTDTNSDNEQVMEDSLDSLGWICENTVSISIVNEDCLTTWKNFVTNSLRYKFESSEVLRILSCIIKAIYKKQDKGESLPYGLLSLDTLYEMVLSHSRFLNILLSTDKNMDAKEKLADLMVTIVELSPSCCKSSHLPVLFAAYSATLSATDQSILYLMNLYEKNHISFRNYRPFLWGPAAARHHQVSKSLSPSLLQQPTVTEVMEQMAASKMFQSAVSFPQGRLLQPQVQMEVACEGLRDLYDPCFLLPLFSCLLAPNFQVDCRKFVEQGCLGLSVAALSSRDGNMRKAGYHVLSRYMMHLDGVRFREKKQIFHLLTYLKNSITEEYCRLSSLMTCFLARVAFILLKPEHPFYIMMNSFLLQRPALDLKDLPLFYNMFNSSTMQHATERSWMLQLLVNGMKDSPDYYLYKRRHVIELALSYHDSPVSDHRSQTLVTQLLLSALKIQPAAYDLTKNYGIVAWIHSLCYKSSARLQTSLDLLHTLWFTLQSPDKESGNVTEEVKPRRPPNLAPECSLVCWTLLEQLRSCSSVNCICRYLRLLASVLTCLETNGKPSGLSYDRIISLLRLWCETFQETVMLNQLLTTLNLSGKCDGVLKTTNAPPEQGRANLKTESLSSLLAVLLTWKPSGVETHLTVRLIWHFGLAQCQRKVLNFETPLVGEDQRINCIPSLLRWFKKCLVEDLTLQDLLVTEKSEVKLILQLFRVVPPTNTKSSVQIGDLRRDDPKSSLLTVMKELNIICLVLLAAVQRVKLQGKEESSPQPTVFQLVSKEPYNNIIKELKEVIFPLLPDPCSDLEDRDHQDQDLVVHELVSLFVQELWLEKPIPRQFLSNLLYQCDNGYPVVNSLILAFGGEKSVSNWIQKDDS